MRVIHHAGLCTGRLSAAIYIIRGEERLLTGPDKLLHIPPEPLRDPPARLLGTQGIPGSIKTTQHSKTPAPPPAP
ncbi:unnamed protein product [Arctogadus glacialis]